MGRKHRIQKVLEEADRTLSINRVAEEIGEHWKTVDKKLHKLLDESKVERKEISPQLLSITELHHIAMVSDCRQYQHAGDADLHECVRIIPDKQDTREESA